MVPGRYRFIIALLLFLAGAINYMDRAAIGVVAPLLNKDFVLSPSALGMTFSIFFIGYAMFAFIGGQLADRYGPRRVYSWAAITWSLFCGLTGAVTGFTQLLIVRTLFGFAEGPMNATCNRTITNWFPRKETSRAVGVTFSGQTVGAALTAPVVGLLAISYGWRFAFIAIALLGVVWVIAWRLVATDYPRENPRVSQQEIDYIESNRIVEAVAHEGHHDPLRSYLLRPSILSLALGMFAVNYVLYIFLSWLPSYLTDALHLEIKQMAFVAAIPWLCGFIGYFGGGFACDFVYLKMTNKLTARKITTILPLGVAAIALLLIGFTTTATAAVTLIAVSVAMLTASVQSCWATIREVVPEPRLGGVSGFIHMLSNISGIVGPTVTGIAVQYFGGFSSAFVIAAALSVAAVVAMSAFVKRPAVHAVQPVPVTVRAA
ncbi:MAG: MFS transporter [Acetobacteraceae bacterium]|nr:MFS transporter [Acetobacteraceae bacterium]